VSHVRLHTPAELSEGRKGAPDTPARGERLLEIGAVLLLSLATLATAWSGYEAARWSGEQSQNYARASAGRIQAQRQATAAGQQRIDDLLNFNGWLNARQAGDRALAATYERRFRSGFVPAFRAWLAQRPFTNPRAIPGPLYMPQYRLAQSARAAQLDAQAGALYLAGTKAKSTGDRYVLSTVFFAAVLFFAGISLRLQWRPLRLTVLSLAGVMILLGLGFVISLPVA
jgi:hypothetical protein